MTVWLTADTHFGHANILGLACRPFAGIREHDEALIGRWNTRVAKGDEVWHLGGFALGLDEPALSRLFGRLHGRKHLIGSNHDGKRTRRLPRASQPQQMREVVIDGQRVERCHYALRSWRRIHAGAVHLYGHTHGSISGTRQSEDVGVDAWSYAPVALPDLLARMADNTILEEELRHAAEEERG